MPQKVLWRLVVWLVLFFYLALDLFVFQGPMSQRLGKKKEVAQLSDSQRGIAARVFHKPIYLSQLDYAVDEKLWTKGRTREGISEKERIYLRQVALRDLADQYILRTKLREQITKYPVSEERISAAVKRFSNRFVNKAEMVAALKKQGIRGEKELRYRLAAKLQQDDYIQKFITVSVDDVETEAIRCYEKYGDQAVIPERVRVQHVFCAKLENSEEEALKKLAQVMEGVSKSDEPSEMLEKFAALVSEDERTKKQGGHLGWVRRHRIAPDFTEQVFSAELGVPSLIETQLGWHVIMVLEKRGPTKRSYEDAKPEIMAALQNHELRNNVEKFRLTLRKQLADRIKVNWKVLQAPWTVVQ